MDIVYLIGCIAVINQLSLIFWGMPHQACVIWKNKSDDNVSIPHYGNIISSCFWWFLFGLLTKNAFLCIPQIPAMLLAGLIIALAQKYRKTPTLAIAK